jgi:hypothetical protein
VPLFQEQLLRIAMTVANFSGAEADELRRAVGMRRSWERMKNLEGKLRAGMAANGIDTEDAGSHCAAHQLVRAVWISRVARCQLRSDRVCVGVSQSEIPGRVHMRHPEQSADGFLFAGCAGEGCAAAWAARETDRRSGVGLALHHRTRRRWNAFVAVGAWLREGSDEKSAEMLVASRREMEISALLKTSRCVSRHSIGKS